MSYNIIWSPTAKQTYYKNIEYLLGKWSTKEAGAFVTRVEEVISFIKYNP
jgi:plasmid stabilization system protein ParE